MEQTATMERLAPAQDYSVEIPTKDKAGARFVFTVADLITSAVKDQNPLWALGGVVREGVQTLKHQNGYIRRCEITGLRQYMDSTLSNFVHESQRAHMPAAYIITEPDPAAPGTFRKRTIGGSDGLLRSAFYPVDEIGSLTGQNDGIVEMPCTTAEEARRAQQFLFPQWESIKAGDTPLPEKTSQLRAWFMKRLAEAQEAEKGRGTTFFSDVARAAIRSCDSFNGWGNRLITEQNREYEKAKANGWGWTYGGSAEMVFAQLGIARRDNIMQEQTDKMDALTDNITKLAEMQANQMRANQTQASVEDFSPVAEAPAVPPTVEEPVVDPQAPVDAPPKCLATTKAGAPCKNDALEDGFCNREDHSAAAEAAKSEEDVEKS